MPFRSRARPLLRLRLSRESTAALIVGLAAVAIASIGSWIPSLWGDEAASVLSARRSLPSLLHELSHVDAVHGTYYAGLHVWVDLFGTSPFSIRFPSALAVGAAVAAVVLIGARMRSLPTGVVAGVICAVLPRITYVGEEARSYAFSAAIAAWLTLILIVAIRRRGRTRALWVAYGVLLCVGVYVFLYLALVALAHALVLVLVARHRAVLLPAGIAMAAGIAGAGPLIVAAILERAQIAYLASRTEVTPDAILVTLWFGQVPFAVVGWLLTVAGLVIALGPWIRRRPGRTRGVGELLVASWLLVPAIVLIGTSPIVAGFTARYLAMCAPAVALLMSLPIVALAVRWRPALIAGTAAVVLVGAVPWASQRTPYAKNDSDWAEVSADLHRVVRPGDAIVFDESVRPSRRTRLALRAYPIPVAWRDPTLDSPYWRNTTWHDTAMSVGRAAAAGRFDGVHRVWLVDYAIGPDADTYGIADLERLGYRRVGQELSTHRSRIIEFVATP